MHSIRAQPSDGDIKRIAYWAWFKLALQTVERFAKSFPARFTCSLNKYLGNLHKAEFARPRANGSR
jgi:hypothetical protein